MKVRFSDFRDAFPDLEDLQATTQRGGQKVVFRAKKEGRPVVLKIFRKLGSDTARIEREIEAMARVASEVVPTIYQHGWRRVGPGRIYFLVEQAIQGISLREFLYKHNPFSMDEALYLAEVLIHACCSFEAVHVVHRDIKPENIMVDHNGKIWVIDLGTVRILDMESLTATGLYKGLGTIGYAPPEQFLNLKKAIDIRTDLYATGIVLYEVLKGYNPYLAAMPKVMVVLKTMQTVPLQPLRIEGDEGGAFSRLIGRLVQPSPTHRPETAEAVQAELARIVQRKGVDEEGVGVRFGRMVRSAV